MTYLVQFTYISPNVVLGYKNSDAGRTQVDYLINSATSFNTNGDATSAVAQIK